MADTTSTHLALVLPEDGASDDTWGVKLSADLTKLDLAFGAVTAIATVGGTTSLTAAQQRVCAIEVTGVLASAAEIDFNATGGAWILYNGTSGTYALTAKVTAGAAITITQGAYALIYRGNDGDLKKALEVPAFTSLGLSLATAASAAAARTLIGTVIGTDVQAHDADLDTLAALASIANLTALAGLTGAADKVPYFTGVGALALADLPSFARTFLALTTAATQRTAMGVAKHDLFAIITNGGSVLAAGNKCYIGPFTSACTIKQITGLADLAGSVVVDVYKCTYTNYDPTTHPASGDKITASAPLTLSAVKKQKDITLTGWNVDVAVDDVLEFIVTGSPATITQLTVGLGVERA